MKTTGRGRARRRRRGRNEETREQQLARIQASDNEANYPAIIAGFKARGITEAEIVPRENVFTYRAWQAKGRQVRKGEKSVKIDVWIQYEKKDTEGDEKKVGRSRRSVAVFHVSQTDPIRFGKPLPDARPDSEKPDEDKPQPRPKPGNPSGDGLPRRRGVSAERLRDLADNMEKRIQDKLHPAISRQNFTHRRARIAASMREDAYRMQTVQSARRKMADAIDADTLPDCLVGVFSESDLERLTSKYYREGNGRESLTQAQQDAADWLHGEEIAQHEAERDAQRRRDERMRELMTNPPEGFFPTPAGLAARMVELADIQSGDEVLEPSAGMGHLCEAYASHVAARVDEFAGDAGLPSLIVVEQDGRLCEYLREEGFSETVQADILDVCGEVDRVVMNPPYERKQDLRHVRHCFGMLKPGGKLVALVSAGFQYRADRETCDFREWMQSETVVDHCEIIDDAFKGPESMRQTGVRVGLLVLSKPEAQS